MGREIERKFLVVDDRYRAESTGSVEMKQGYISTRAEGTVRVRVAGARAWLTVKSRNHGATRGEWEFEIPAADAADMLAETTTGAIVEKTRYYVKGADGLLWEVDEFHGSLEGLVVAEVELDDEERRVALPSWVGREVTGDARYYNSMLSTGVRPEAVEE